MPEIDPFDEVELDDEDGIVCRRCNKANLYWQKIYNRDGLSERSALFDSADNRQHFCEPSADDFEVVS